MPTITGGFTTKKNVLKQFKDSGVSVKLPFKAIKEGKNELDVTIDPMEGVEAESFDGEEQIINKL